MKSQLPDYLKQYADQQRLARLLTLPDTHYFGIGIQKDEIGATLRARYSPDGEQPRLIRVDGIRKQFFCTCEEFQKKAGYPVRLGIFVCDHILRLLMLLDPPDREALDLNGGWSCLKTSHGLERVEILTQADRYFEQGDVLSGLSELYTGIARALLPDQEVSRMLKQVDSESVAAQDLPEAMRFVRVALQRGFTRKARELAGSWIARFAQQVDSYAPFDDVAPVAMWLRRWSATPDVHLAEIRELVLESLEKAKSISKPDASWWLLYRAVSRSSAAPPESCVAAWTGEFQNMRLALVNPDRINDFARLLAEFGIKELGAGKQYKRMYVESIRRASETRMSFLLRLADAHHLKPFLAITSNPYFGHQSVSIEVEPEPGAVRELILSAIGYQGAYLPADRLVDNWPILLRCSTNPPELVPELRNRVESAWPNPVAAPSVSLAGFASVSGREQVGTDHFVVRWTLAGPGLIYGSPVVSHHDNRIYIPARGGSSWPEPFGLALCKQPTAMGRRLFTLRVVCNLDAPQAIQRIKSGATWVGPRDDAVRLLSVSPGLLSAGRLLDLHRSLKRQDLVLGRATWMPDRTYLRENIKPKTTELRVWARKKVWEALAAGKVIASGDIGFLFGDGLSIRPDNDTLRTLSVLATRSQTFDEWFDNASVLITDALPYTDRVDAPIDVEALVGTNLQRAVPAIVDHRKKELASVRVELREGYYDLTGLKNTVFGRMLLQQLDLGKRQRLPKDEADELIRSLNALDVGVDALAAKIPGE